MASETKWVIQHWNYSRDEHTVLPMYLKS